MKNKFFTRKFVPAAQIRRLWKGMGISMNKKDIVEWFAANSANLSGVKILLLLCIGTALGAVIFMIYKVTYQGVSYNAKFNFSNVIILLITEVIMMMISSNIVVSLGMVGALSIVRFRTAVKDARDTVYIFWAIVEGLCVGSQNMKLAVVSTLFIAIVIVAATFAGRKKDAYVLIIRGGEAAVSQEDVEQVIHQYAVKHELKTVNRTEYSTEMVYEIRAKETLNMKLAEEVRAIDAVESVNWLLKTGEMAG
ncbi:DUF4956 domain-containing protein [bacterium C-53]|nr:DUF4956 domain-containing protein [Lachnospiraceae bacterium]NBI03811.1 DUF4956 domain-containing protein [Lachnospiraceae bacterium]RKJ09158.1 DUF4956 domain-containing protein [bacterium C-53]